MLKLYMIVAVCDDLGIGKNGQLPWHVPEDLAWFKKTTLGHTVVMGRKTYQSIGKPLPSRTNFVITNQPNLIPKNEHVITGTKHEFLSYLNSIATGKDGIVFVIGGASLFEDFAHLCDGLYLTRIKGTFDCDVFFPQNVLDQFDIKYQLGWHKSKIIPHVYQHEFYERKHV